MCLTSKCRLSLYLILSSFTTFNSGGTEGRGGMGPHLPPPQEKNGKSSHFEKKIGSPPPPPRILTPPCPHNNFWCRHCPSTYHFFCRPTKAPNIAKIVCFLPSFVLLSVKKIPDRYSKICEKAPQKAGTQTDTMSM